MGFMSKTNLTTAAVIAAIVGGAIVAASLQTSGNVTVGGVINGNLGAYANVFDDNTGGADVTVTVTSAGTYYPIQSMLDAVTPVSITNDADAGAQTLALAGTYVIRGTISFNAPAGAVVSWFVHDGGTKIPQCGFSRTMGAAAAIGNAGFECLYVVEAADVLDLRVTSDGNGDAITVDYVSMSMERVDD